MRHLFVWLKEMQKADISAVLIPILLEQIFKRFSDSFSVGLGDTENLLLDLHKLLGRRLVPAALNILDHQTIVVYTNFPKTVEIAEISYGHSSFRFVRLFLQVNYCTCEYFKEKVLIKKDPYTAPYTCHHILALRLALTLRHKCLHFKEVPSHNLDLLLMSFIPTSSEVE